MDVDSDEELLHRLAAGGTINYDHWPRLLQTVIARLQSIVESEYPIPIIPPPRRTQSKLPQPPWPGRTGSDASNGVGVASSSRAPIQGADAVSRKDVDKENTDPHSAVSPSGATGESSSDDAPAAASGAAANDSSASPAAAEGPSSTVVAATDAAPEMPKPVLDLVDYIITTLKTTFHKYPPHSIQRLAELIIAPRQHYRYLASYLHAVDRVVSVTSGSNVFPLPPAVPESEAMAALQSVVIPSAPADPDSDDDMSGTGLALAANPASDNPLGALLTPIPWLRRRPSSGAGDTTDDDGSSPPSSTNGSDIAFSATSSTAGSVHGGGGANASRAPASLLQQQSQSSASSSQQLLQQQQQGHPPQRRMEVRTEATETIDGPNGVGSIETVSVSINGIPSHGAMVAAVQRQQQRGITQGELLRQEQTAGVVPVSQLARAAAARAAANGMPGFGDRFHPGGHEDEDDEDEDDEDNDMDDDDDDDMERHAHSNHAAAAAASGNTEAQPQAHDDTDMGGTDAENAGTSAQEGEPTKEDKGKGPDGKEDDDEEEIPHARGPQEIGAADMGPQRPSSRTAAGAGGGSRDGSGASLLIGSAADASQVDMRDIDVEAAVGRKASALPPGTVAAPVVPFSSRESVRENASGDEPAAATAAAATTPLVRSTTPKREAENELKPDGLAKKRKEDHNDGKDSPAAPTATTASSEETAAESKKADAQEAEDKPATDIVDKSSKKDIEASAAA